ncbi:Breast carcinoma-amplified sequence 3-like protein [Armadillidium vulgare]|nr:Breast carcinoma-amplified sequence 3-like protein [Armadillidium vulgare]
MDFSINPIALGDQWLAFADRRLYSIHQSCGGVVPEGSSSYKSTVIYAAKSITKGLKELGETVASNFMGPKRVNGREVNLGGGSCPGLIAHFVAHLNVPIVALEFDASGMLLATADKLGHNFNVFRIQPHPLSSAQAAIHHLYTLYRGDTTAKVMDISFSLDSRWIAISTHRGTTHVYPITPYGGSIGMRTHKSVCVVNRLSRFQRSAGLDDAPSSGRNSPVLSTSPGVSKLAFEPSPNLAYQNPRYPPYPSPVTIKPLAQLRQPLLQNLIESIAPGPSPSHSPPSNKSSKVACPEQIVKVASIFGATRGWLAGSPTVPREIKRHSVDSLFVMAYHGNLIEYYLEPKPISSLPQEKITEDSPIALEVHASAQWSLVRESTSYEIGPPLLSSNPLLLPREKSRPRSESPAQSRQKENSEDKWMAQVEIYTHAGPPRRLWMGPQFTFKSLPGTGHLAGDQTSSETFTDPSLTFPYPGSHSPRHSMESDHFDPDNIMNRLRSDLADAMLDTPQISSGSHKRDSGGGLSDSPTGDDQGFDFSDIMDISCDPPGPSSIGTNSSSQDIPMPMQEEQIQAVTAKLHQVAVTSQPGATTECVSPFWGSRTPSLEECRALTSSAEELASTLDRPRVEERNVSSFAWIPIDPPKPVSQSTSIRKPEPLDRRDSPKGAWGRRVETFSNDDVTLKPSWNVVDDILSQNNNNNHLPEDAFPPIISGVSKSATTSEDDLWTAKEGNRKDRRRKKRKNRTDEGNDEVIFTPGTFTIPKNLSPSSSPILPIAQNLSPSFDVDLDHFHTAEEFHDPLESSPLHVNLPRKEALLKSIHEGDDLARALEEASSDEGNIPVKTTVGNVKGEADEMFPFRESSSDEDEGRITVRVRRRNVLLSHNHSLNDEEDDDRDTSGDDRKLQGGDTTDTTDEDQSSLCSFTSVDSSLNSTDVQFSSPSSFDVSNASPPVGELNSSRTIES